MAGIDLTDDELWTVLNALTLSIERTPNFWTNVTAGANGSAGTVRPCKAGQGSRGGTSRGTGSGSRLRLWECECDKPVKVRVASDDFRATCDVCEQAFTRK